VERKGLLVPVTPLTPAKDGEQVETRTVRFRTVGDITCTCPVESPAATAGEIVIETLAAEVSERGATRMDDKTSTPRWKSARKTGISDDKHYQFNSCQRTVPASAAAAK
jgi:sulfate adenylyltransferase subunit 2